jgi:hypothetical protein
MADDPRYHAPRRPEHAFVIQFSPNTQVDGGPVEGRMEHLVSRQATRFQSLEALLAFISRVLREVRDAHPTPES